MMTGRDTIMVRCSDGVARPRKSRRTLEEIKLDFWARVKMGKPDECWEWSKARNSLKSRYGIVWWNGRKWKAHRLAFYLTHGEIDDSLLVCHKCDNPPCCNPNHLFQGTNVDNSNDKFAKGRQRFEHGEDRYNSKLTADHVREIRRRFVKGSKENGLAALGREFGVYDTMIHHIVTRRRWKHVV